MEFSSCILPGMMLIPILSAGFVSVDIYNWGTESEISWSDTGESIQTLDNREYL